MAAPRAVVTAATEADAALLQAVSALLPQLSSSSPPPTIDRLARLIADPATTLLVATDPEGGAVLGMLTLALFQLPTGVRAWVEDVVVDDTARGRGVGAALVEAALARARQQGARTVDLTSRASRGAANRLYLRLGFAPRETNVYRFTLD
jgi:ribosomal protein S18 acetylase RimI-like enzyme